MLFQIVDAKNLVIAKPKRLYLPLFYRKVKEGALILAECWLCSSHTSSPSQKLRDRGFPVFIDSFLFIGIHSSNVCMTISLCVYVCA